MSDQHTPIKISPVKSFSDQKALTIARESASANERNENPFERPKERIQGNYGGDYPREHPELSDLSDATIQNKLATDPDFPENDAPINLWPRVARGLSKAVREQTGSSAPIEGPDLTSLYNRLTTLENNHTQLRTDFDDFDWNKDNWWNERYVTGPAFSYDNHLLQVGPYQHCPPMKQDSNYNGIEELNKLVNGTLPFAELADAIDYIYKVGLRNTVYIKVNPLDSNYKLKQYKRVEIYPGRWHHLEIYSSDPLFKVHLGPVRQWPWTDVTYRQMAFHSGLNGTEEIDSTWAFHMQAAYANMQDCNFIPDVKTIRNHYMCQIGNNSYINISGGTIVIPEDQEDDIVSQTEFFHVYHHSDLCLLNGWIIETAKATTFCSARYNSVIRFSSSYYINDLANSLVSKQALCIAGSCIATAAVTNIPGVSNTITLDNSSFVTNQIS